MQQKLPARRLRHHLQCKPSASAAHHVLPRPAASLDQLRSAAAQTGGHVETSAFTLKWHPAAVPFQLDQVYEDVAKQVQKYINEVKDIFISLDLGEISISPYDTAWVAMVPSLDDSQHPQFPQCLDWIVQNQLLDGSWGDKDIFLAYERVCNTLACVVALKTWSYSQENMIKGVKFIHENIDKMGNEANDYMPTAFEVIFPALLEDAQLLGIDLPYDSLAVEKLKRERKKKLERIPMELLHSHPTTLLHSLEGLHKLVNWNKILKLQTKNGSFLFSPASTACALKYTHDSRCLDYLNCVLQKFHNAVPSVYPVDIFERLWMVDRLERLGISRYFDKEIKEVLDYVFRYWTQKGLAWAKESSVFDVDDTAMGFRLLRLHGYKVSPDVFNQFKNEEEFYCFEGQTSQAVTGMHNLHRASQVMFPNETILEEVYKFTHSFLVEKQKEDKIHDKWVISKGVKGEVAYLLNHPWCQSLQRIETRDFIEHYGVDDAWIAKSLYKMPHINNEVYLKLAKLDYNFCQFLHQKDLAQVLMWNEECKFNELKFARQKPIECFFSVAATLFEPEYCYARIVWAKCSVLVTLIDDFYDVQGSLCDLEKFLHAIERWDPVEAKNFSEDMKILYFGLYNTMNTICQEAFKCQGHDFTSHLKDIVARFVRAMYIEAKWKFLNHIPSLQEYMKNAKDSIALEAILQSTTLFLGDKILEKDFENEDYLCIMNLVSIIARLNNDLQGVKREQSQGKCSCVSLFMKENPTATETEAIHHFRLIMDNTMKLLLKKCLEESKEKEDAIGVHTSCIIITTGMGLLETLE
ncbi:hypothetical protein GOP47_0014492 [Adiantum capillus-veneris]|uniref:Uncharacterized protein n=1 Tax=Adiantum capillus-veneris TaxID=13818 RepID=A0A9D4ZCH9_ADICA|nr:hypothetical protein GOP47_0014492 [Adiantum capillus-veneris]